MFFTTKLMVNLSSSSLNFFLASFRKRRIDLSELKDGTQQINPDCAQKMKPSANSLIKSYSAAINNG